MVSLLLNIFLIITSLADKFPMDDDSVHNAHPLVADSNEELLACNILRIYYSALSQSLIEPVSVASELYLEHVITRETLDYVISIRGQSINICKGVLLKAIRAAVHFNFKHLELLASVLRKINKTVHIGDAIFRKYSE